MYKAKGTGSIRFLINIMSSPLKKYKLVFLGEQSVGTCMARTN